MKLLVSAILAAVVLVVAGLAEAQVIMANAAGGYAQTEPDDLDLPDDVSVAWNSNTGTVSSMHGYFALPEELSAAQLNAADAALGFLDTYAELFGIGNVQDELLLTSSDTDDLGMHHVRFQQIYQGVPVYLGEIRVHLTADQTAVTAASSSFLPRLELDSVDPQLVNSHTSLVLPHFV